MQNPMFVSPALSL